MGKPRFLSDNLFSTRQFPDHTVTASEEASGQQAERVATGRRGLLDYWTPTSTNTAAWVEVACDRLRAADMLALDRNHNLAGETVRLQVSADDFTTYREVFSLTLPSYAGDGSTLDSTYGARTEEGAWLIRFEPEAGTYWRLYVDAMGTGLKPEVGGLWLGLSWQPGEYPERPHSDSTAELVYEERRSDAAWVGTNQPAHPRTGDMGVLLTDAWEYDRARLTVEEHYHKRRRPMWIVPDDEQAERAFLAVPPRGAFGFRLESSGWAWRQARVPYVEHEPERD